MQSREPTSQSEADLVQFAAIRDFFERDEANLIEKIDGFPKYASRQSIAKFLTKYEIFKRILDVNGSIVECGVLYGAGLLAWAKLSSILEPVNHTRKVIGFDTFMGFLDVTPEDTGAGASAHVVAGGLTGSTLDNVAEAVAIYDMNRPLGHIPKVELVKGDIAETAPQYLAQNRHLVVSLLYLDLDLYLPTKAALKAFLPRMPTGAIICFDELNARAFPGETVAVEEVLGLPRLKIERFPFDPYVSFAVL